MRTLIFSIFVKVYQYLCGTGLGKLPLAGWANDFLYNRLKPRGDVALVEAQGYKMCYNPRDMGLPRMLLMYGYYEKYSTELFRRIIKRGDVFLDIGANLGHYTLIAANLVGENGKVYAFEPAPSNYDLLVKSMKVNGYENIVAIPKAVSNMSGMTRLVLNPHESGIYHLDSLDSDDSVIIEAITLDVFFKDKEKRVNIIKMDVEGAEMLALEGMSEILKSNDNLTIFTEFSPVMIRRAGSSPEEFLKQFVGYGFELFHINESEERLDPVDMDRAMQIGIEEKWANFLCLKGMSKKGLGI